MAGIASKVDPATIERLALIKYLFNVASDQSREPEPMSALSILSFHDSAELFLQLAMDFVDTAGSKKTDFMAYFQFIDDALESGSLTQKNGMRRLNQARVSLKHYGILPSTIEVERFRVLTSAFLEENSLLVFGLDLNQISLIDYVPHEGVRNALKSAREYTDADPAKSMSDIAVAFRILIDSVIDGYLGRFHRSPFPPKQDFSFDSAFFRRSGPYPDDDGREQFEDKLMKAVDGMQQPTLILSLGLDYRKYVKFSLMTPSVRRGLNGQYVVQVVQGLAGSIDWPPSPQACEFCIDFVIESAIRMRELQVDSIMELNSVNSGPHEEDGLAGDARR